MSQAWDSFDSNKALQEWTEEWATEALRVIKPGGIMLCFAGTRTQHRIACGIEDAGWIIKDTIMWCYGSGFPKSHNIGKAVDKKLGNEREFIGYKKLNERDKKVYIPKSKNGAYNPRTKSGIHNNEQTKGNSKWEGYGTALKPAYEPIIMAMKSIDGTYVENALKWNVAGINIDGARIPLKGDKKTSGGCKGTQRKRVGYAIENPVKEDNSKGRFPANLILENCEEVEECFPETKSGQVKQGYKRHTNSQFIQGNESQLSGYGDSGSASRYFKRIKYCAKASKEERNRGINKEDFQNSGRWNKGGEFQEIVKKGNYHPCVKPVKLLEYLVELTKMPNEDQVYLDPFCGSGTTCIASAINGREYIGIEKEESYCEIARARIKGWTRQGSLF